jgi:hypothetical protein
MIVDALMTQGRGGESWCHGPACGVVSISPTGRIGGDRCDCPYPAQPPAMVGTTIIEPWDRLFFRRPFRLRGLEPMARVSVPDGWDFFMSTATRVHGRGCMGVVAGLPRKLQNPMKNNSRSVRFNGRMRCAALLGPRRGWVQHRHQRFSQAPRRWPCREKASAARREHAK